MSRLRQLQQEVAALEDTVKELADELYRLYEDYLNSLSQVARQQLIVASYQVCTQVYPESFLTLTLKHREQLQEEIRQLGDQLLPQFLACLTREIKTDLEKLNLMEQMLDLPDEAIETPLVEEPADEELVEPELPMTDPETVVHWYQQVEQGIAETLENASKETNNLLHRVQVLPSQLPASIINVALEAEETGASVSASPNLLNLLIEAEGESASAIAKITAIRLRRSEIEFSDPSLSNQRQPIRRAVETLNQLRQQYQQKKRDCAIAQAEAAWRASWFDR